MTRDLYAVLEEISERVKGCNPLAALKNSASIDTANLVFKEDRKAACGHYFALRIEDHNQIVHEDVPRLIAALRFALEDMDMCVENDNHERATARILALLTGSEA